MTLALNIKFKGSVQAIITRLLSCCHMFYFVNISASEVKKNDADDDGRRLHIRNERVISRTRPFDKIEKQNKPAEPTHTQPS